MRPAPASSAPDDLELPAHRGQGFDDVVLRQLAQPGKHPGAPQCRPHQRSAQPASFPGKRGQPRHVRLGLPRRLAELPVRRLAGIVQPQVVGKDTEDVGRVVGPAGHPQIDFRHGPVTVAAQETGEPGLHDGGEPAGAVAADQLRHGCVVEYCVEHCGVEDRGGCGVGPDIRGELPQGQVHFGGHVAGKSPQDRLQRPGAGAASQQPAGDCQQGKAQRGQRQDVGYHREEFVPQDALHVVQPLRRR